MAWRSIGAPILLAALGAALAGCDTVELEPAPTPTPTLTPTVTAIPTPSPTRTPQSIADAPPLPDRATPVVSGEIHLDVPAGGAERVNPIELTEEGGGQPPPCAAFVSSWEWTATPEEAAGSLGIQSLVQGNTIELASGGAGSFNAGCSELAIVNGSEEAVSVDLRYAVGSLGS